MNKYYNADLNSYDEPRALEQLLKATDCAMKRQIESDEQNECDETTDQFTITIGGVQTAFMLGGPQVDALYAFIDYIASENFYAVDFDKLTVEG